MFFFFTEGCPFGCSGHGTCEIINSTWSCVCEGLYHGPGCSIGTETDCTDEVDNDGGKTIKLFFFFIYAKINDYSGQWWLK